MQTKLVVEMNQRVGETETEIEREIEGEWVERRFCGYRVTIMAVSH